MKYSIFRTRFTKNGRTPKKNYVLMGETNNLNEAKKIFNKAKKDTIDLKEWQMQITELWLETTLIDVDERRKSWSLRK